MKEESEGLKTERINGKESEIDIVKFFEKENELINEDLIRKVPVNESNNEEEIVPEVPKLEMLIEDDSERGENEVIENEVIDETPINEVVSIDIGFEIPKIMNESAEEEVVIGKEHYKGKN